MDGHTFIIGNFGIDTSIRLTQVHSHAAGTALRCSLGASLFGLRVTPIAVAGFDPEFDDVLNCLKGRGANLQFVKRVNQSIRFTTTYGPQFEILDFRIENKHLIDTLVEHADQIDLSGAKCVVVGPLPLPAMQRYLTRANTVGALSVLITHYSIFSECNLHDLRGLLTQVDYVILNLDEGRTITGLVKTMDVGYRLSKMTCRGVFLTLHEQGACFFDKSGDSLCLPSLATTVSDVLGSGDVFAGGAVAGLHFTSSGRVALTYGLISSALSLAQPNHRLLFQALGNKPLSPPE